MWYICIPPANVCNIARHTIYMADGVPNAYN